MKNVLLHFERVCVLNVGTYLITLLFKTRHDVFLATQIIKCFEFQYDFIHIHLGLPGCFGVCSVCKNSFDLSFFSFMNQYELGFGLLYFILRSTIHFSKLSP